jgi:hypothetical protein
VRRARFAGLLAVLIWAGVAAWNTIKPLPAGTRVASLNARLDESQLDVIDDADGGGNILARELAVIDRADQMIVLDQAPLARETGQHLLIRKRQRPHIKIVVLADPLPEIYGGTPAHYLDSLEQAGIIVARTRLGRLRDPLPWYSALWRMSIGWWSDPYDEIVPRAGLRASLRRSNFKADRRQILVADDGSGGWIGVAPAAEGRGIAVAIAGGVARDMAASELKIAGWSTEDDRLPGIPLPVSLGVGAIDARFLTEGAIRAALVDAFATAVGGDEIRLATPELSDRSLITAMLEAVARGARVHVLLDADVPPNPAVAGELARASTGGGIEVRWLPPGAISSSLSIVRHRQELWVNLGAADFTRLGLDDLDLSAAVDFRLQDRAAAAHHFLDAFEARWSSGVRDAPKGGGDTWEYWRYRALQATGLAPY